MLRPFAHPVACFCMLLGVVAQSLKPVIAMCKQTFDRLPLALASLNYEKADLLGVMNSNRKFDVSFDGTVSSHKNKSHAQCLCFNSRCKNLSSQNSKREKMLISGRHLWCPGRQRLVQAHLLNLKGISLYTIIDRINMKLDKLTKLARYSWSRERPYHIFLFQRNKTLFAVRTILESNLDRYFIITIT